MCLRFKATGKNASSSGYVIPLDSVTLTKLGDKKEFENLPFFATTGETLSLTNDVDADHGRWTKYAANGVNDFVTYAFHVPAGTYSIQVRTKKFTDRGIVQLATSSDNGTYYSKDAAKNLYAASATWTTLSYTRHRHFCDCRNQILPVHHDGQKCVEHRLYPLPRQPGAHQTMT